VNSADNWPLIPNELEEKSLSSNYVYDGILLKVYSDKVKLPDGSESKREYIKHPGASVVLPVFENGDIMLVGQYRYPLRQSFFEVPAGKLDPGEKPEVTAKRELTEETGLVCGKMERIGAFHPCIGYSDEIIHLYTAWNLSCQEQQTEDDEFLSLHRMPYAQALNMIEAGRITDSKTIISLLRTRLWWERQGPFEVRFEER